MKTEYCKIYDLVPGDLYVHWVTRTTAKVCILIYRTDKQYCYMTPDGRLHEHPLNGFRIETRFVKLTS